MSRTPGKEGRRRNRPGDSPSCPASRDEGGIGAAGLGRHQGVDQFIKRRELFPLRLLGRRGFALAVRR